MRIAVRLNAELKGGVEVGRFRIGAHQTVVAAIYILMLAYPVKALAQEGSSLLDKQALPDAPDIHLATVPASDSMQGQTSNGTIPCPIPGRPGSDRDAPASSVFACDPTSIRVTASVAQIAEAQISLEEKQRILGIMPNFFTAYAPNPAPLSRKQKFTLAFKSATDPVAFMISGAYAGVEQANNTYSGFGQGPEGFAKRYAANYADTFVGTMISSAAFPSLLKQDPRYFYQGTGSVRSRVIHAISCSVLSKGDNGHWQPSYSGILGGFAAGAISNLYYPAQNRNGLSLTFGNAATGIVSGALQNLLQEFVIKKFTPRVPRY